MCGVYHYVYSHLAALTNEDAATDYGVVSNTDGNKTSAGK